MILIGADFVPTASNMDLFCQGNSTALFGSELEKLLKQADFRIFNLEIPLCNTNKPINKCGANFIAPEAAVSGYCAAQVDLLTLANNHILDQDEQGLQATCRVLREKGIDYIGVGNTPAEAAIPYIFMFGKHKVGVYACAEHEFSIVTDTRAGANPFDPLESPDHVAALKQQCDFVIVLYHGGKEYYRYPSPRLQKTCRKLVEKGADLVICQHSHCIGCEEAYLNGTIVYGQGNFLFDNSKREQWQTGLLIGMDKRLQIQYFPLVKADNSVKLAEGAKKEEILNAFYARSKEITDSGFVARHYSQYAERELDAKLSEFRGKRSLLFRALNKALGYRLNSVVLRHYGLKERTVLRNYIECESIRELIIAGIEEREE